MWQILSRLAWREWRRGWPALVVGLVVPTVATLLRARYSEFGHTGAEVWQAIDDMASLLVIALPAVQSAVIAAQEAPRRSFLTVHAGVGPLLPVATALLARLAIAGAIGAGMGLWEPSARIVPAVPMAYGALYVASVTGLAFAVGYAFTAALGIAAGVVCLFIGLVQIEGMQADWAYGNFTPYRFPFFPLALATSLAMLVATRWLRTPAARGVGFLAILLVAFWPQVTGLVAGFTLIPSHGRQWLASQPISTLAETADGSAIAVLYPAGGVVEYADLRNDRKVSVPVSGLTRPVGFIDRETVLLAVQRERTAPVELLRWETADNACTSITSIPAPRFGLADALAGMDDCRHTAGGVSPDGRYALLALGSHYMNPPFELRDLWAIDLQRGQARIVVAAIPSAEMQLTWQEDGVVVSGDRAPLLVDLAAGTTHALPVPAYVEEEGQ